MKLKKDKIGLGIILYNPLLYQVDIAVRSPEVFSKKGVLKNFVKFTGKHLCQSLFFNKVAGLKVSNKDTNREITKS